MPIVQPVVAVNTTGNLDYRAGAYIQPADIQTALEDIAGVGEGNVVVSDGGGGYGGPSKRFLVEFTGALANTAMPLIQGTNISLTGGNPANPIITVIQAGTATQNAIQQIEFVDGVNDGEFSLGVGVTIITQRPELQIGIEWIEHSLKNDTAVTQKLLDTNTSIYTYEPDAVPEPYYIVIKAPSAAHEKLWSGGRAYSGCLVSISAIGKVSHVDQVLNALTTNFDYLFDKTSINLTDGAVAQSHRVNHHPFDFRDGVGKLHFRIAAVYDLMVYLS